jgi:hypothetical protein
MSTDADQKKRDYDELVAAGRDLVARERMNHEDFIHGLAMDPERAASAMWEMFEATVSQAEQPFFDEDELTGDEKLLLICERDEQMAKFWACCDILSREMVNHPDRPWPFKCLAVA